MNEENFTMKKLFSVGTRSVLFGAHCWFIHPWFVALAWWKLYGFPRDPRLWVVFFCHDLGYIGKPNMDGPEGEKHVEWGAHAAGMVAWWIYRVRCPRPVSPHWSMAYCTYHDLSLYHSRFYAKKSGQPVSKLCFADKLACCLEPWWLYLPRVILSGEIKEYMEKAGGKPDSKYNGEPVVSKYLSMGIRTRTRREWHSDMTEYMRKWVAEHIDGREDTWTPKPTNETPQTIAP
jgi:hypothetical protein